MVPRNSPPQVRPNSDVNRQRSKSFAEWSLSNRNGSLNDDDQSTTDDSYLKYYQYLEKRKRNNEAAKRSREKRRLNDLLMETRLQQLAHENTMMKTKLDTIKSNPFVAAKANGTFDEPISPTTVPFLGALTPFGYPCFETSFSMDQPCTLPNVPFDGLGLDLTKSFMFFPSPPSYHQADNETHAPLEVDEEYYKIGRRRSLLLPKVSISEIVPYPYFHNDPLSLNTKQYLRIKLLEKRSKSNPCLFEPIPTTLDDDAKVDTKEIDQLKTMVIMDEEISNNNVDPSKFWGKRKISKIQTRKASHLENKFQKICLLQNENNKLKNVMIQLSQEVAVLQNLLV